MSQLRDKLIRSLPVLNEQLNNQDITDFLVGDGVLTTTEYEEIYVLTRGTGRHAGNRMLTHLLIQKHNTQLARFMTRLRDRQPDLAGDVEQCTVDELYQKTCWTQDRTALEQAVVPIRPKPPLPETDSYSDESDAPVKDEEKLALEATVAALSATFAELTCWQFQLAGRDARDQAIAKACARHQSLYMNTAGCLKKFQRKGRIPSDTSGCNACALQGSLYISVCRGEASVRRLYSCGLAELESGNWVPCALPLNDHVAWGHVKIFADDDRHLYCAATEAPRTHAYRVFQRSAGGDWRFVTEVACVRYDFRIACLHGMLVVAGGNLGDGSRCYDVDAYPLASAAAPGSEGWVRLAVDHHYRCIPAVLSDADNEHLYVLGGTGHHDDDDDDGDGDGDVTSLVAVTTLIRRSRLRYEHVPAAVTSLPVHSTFAAAGAGSAIVIAGGCRLADGSGRRGQLSDQCSAFDHMTRRWRALPALSIKQSNPELIIHDGKLFCFWGLMDGGKKCDLIQVLEL